jgi:O-acetyl-ADP-ribose deacetylase (regulator of RNase III)
MKFAPHRRRRRKRLDTLTDMLFKAIADHDREKVKALLTQGADIEAQDRIMGKRPLIVAALLGYREITELLLAHGADLQGTDDFGMTALHWAAQFGRSNIAELLISRGADIQAPNKEGWTPLFSAAANGQKKAAELMIAHGAEVNRRDLSGLTPLHVAAVRGFKDVTELFIAHGADSNAKDMHGMTPLQIAVETLEDHVEREPLTVMRRHIKATLEIAEIFKRQGCREKIYRRLLNCYRKSGRGEDFSSHEAAAKPFIELATYPLERSRCEMIAYGINHTGQMIGAAAQAILDSAGPEVRDAARELLAHTDRALGTVVVTPSFGLKSAGARWIAHVVSTPKHTPKAPQWIRPAMERILDEACARQVLTLGVAALGTAGGITPDSAAQILINVAQARQRTWKEGSFLRPRVIFCLPNPKVYQAFARRLRR